RFCTQYLKNSYRLFFDVNKKELQHDGEALFVCRNLRKLHFQVLNISICKLILWRYFYRVFESNQSLVILFFSNVVVTDIVVCVDRSEEHTSELQSRENLVCRLLLEKKKQK